ncbi:hypothetical protein [Chryseobacterium wanjuense]
MMRAVKIGKENEKLIKKAKNDLYSCKHYRLIGTAYLNFGLDDQGMSDLKRALEYNKNIEDQNKKYIELAMIYHVLGLHEAIRGDAQGQKVKYTIKKNSGLSKILITVRKWNIQKTECCHFFTGTWEYFAISRKNQRKQKIIFIKHWIYVINLRLQEMLQL